MKASKIEQFTNSTAEDSPTLKLIKYIYFIELFPNEAPFLKDDMGKLALENKLVVLYKEMCEKLKVRGYQTNPLFQKLRQNMVNDTNSLHNDAKNYKAQNNTQKLAATYLKLGRIYFSYGDYKETTIQFNNLSLLNSSAHTIKYGEYACEFALSFYYQGEYYNLFRFNSKPIDKAVLKKLPDLCIIRDINNIECHKRNLDQPFSNVLEMELTNMELSQNRVMSYSDLGFLYSMLAIAYKKKSDIKFVKWSFKLENQFMGNKYKHVLETLQKEREIRCFLPIIKRIYDGCFAEIKKRILMEIISSFDRCPFKMIEQMTGINQGQLRVFVKDNYRKDSIPLLFDPITSSVVYNRSSAPLYNEVKTLYDRLKKNFEEEISAATREGDDEYYRRGMEGMFSMGGMGGMGGMRGMMLGGIKRGRSDF